MKNIDIDSSKTDTLVAIDHYKSIISLSQKVLDEELKVEAFFLEEKKDLQAKLDLSTTQNDSFAYAKYVNILKENQGYLQISANIIQQCRSRIAAAMKAVDLLQITYDTIESMSSPTGDSKKILS